MQCREGGKGGERSTWKRVRGERSTWKRVRCREVKGQLGRGCSVGRRKVNSEEGAV